MSAVQFNLLPDLKLNYVKSQRTRNIVLTNAIIITVASFSIFLIMMFTVNVVQKRQLSGADNEVSKATQELKQVKNIEEVLTVQNQLKTLSQLHSDKYISSRIFAYLPQITPTNAKVGNLSLDFVEGTLQLDGTANSQHTVNTFIDTLKFTTFKSADTDRRAFPSVVLSSFSINQGNVSYSLAIKFEPELFSNTLKEAPKLTVPQLTTTRSALGDPANTLFNGQVGGTPAGQGGR